MSKQITGKRKIYVASSWRNMNQPLVVGQLRTMGHEVYDFRNPTSGDPGFSWREIDESWASWSLAQYVEALSKPAAVRGFSNDFNAMNWADTFVLVQPCGRSAHLELGWAVGKGKTTVMVFPEIIEPELMVKMCDHITDHLGMLELFEIVREKVE